MTHTIVLQETGQQLVAVTVKREPGKPLPAMMIQVPLGLFLPDGVKIKIDDGALRQLDVQTCNAEGCYAGTSVSQDLLTALMAGQGLTVSFSSLSKKPMTIPMPLAGFSSAYQQARPRLIPNSPDPG